MSKLLVTTYEKSLEQLLRRYQADRPNPYAELLQEQYKNGKRSWGRRDVSFLLRLAEAFRLDLRDHINLAQARRHLVIDEAHHRFNVSGAPAIRPGMTFED